MTLEKTIEMILDEVRDELQESDVPVTIESQIQLLEGWVQDFEELTPRNRLEKKIHNALHGAIEQLLAPITASHCYH